MSIIEGILQITSEFPQAQHRDLLELYLAEMFGINEGQYGPDDEDEANPYGYVPH